MENIFGFDVQKTENLPRGAITFVSNRKQVGFEFTQWKYKFEFKLDQIKSRYFDKCDSKFDQIVNEQ